MVTIVLLKDFDELKKGQEFKVEDNWRYINIKFGRGHRHISRDYILLNKDIFKILE